MARRNVFEGSEGEGDLLGAAREPGRAGAAGAGSADVLDGESAGGEDELDQLKVEFFETMRRLHQVKPVTFGTFEGVTATEARALLMIGVVERGQGPDAVRPGCVASHMHVTPSALSQVLKALEDKGLVSRTRGGSDFRAVVLALTPRGLALEERIEQRWTQQACDLVRYVGLGEFHAMLTAANRVADYFEKVGSGEIDAPYFGSFNGGGGGAACE